MLRAIGMVEFTSIARGIYAADQMVKGSDVEIVNAGSVCPGKYIAIVHGEVSAVQDAVEIGTKFAEEYLVDSILIPNVHPDLFPAITCATMPDRIRSLGIIESFSLSTMIIAADATLKSADLQPIELRLGNGLGGKSYFTFTGDVAAVQTGVEAGQNVSEEKGLLVNSEVIAAPSEVLLESLL